MGTEDEVSTETTETTQEEKTSPLGVKETPTEVRSDDESATKDASKEAGEATPYEPFTLPEGWEITDEDLTAFSELAQDMQLDQANAQKLVDLFIAVQESRSEPEADPVDGPAEWQAQLHADKELGGKNLPQTQANVDMVLKVMPEATLKHFQETGAHFEPHIITMLNTIGQMMQEDTINLGGAGGERDGKTPAQKMFANSGHV